MVFFFKLMCVEHFGMAQINTASTISNDFSSETFEPTITKFHMEPPRAYGNKILFKWSGSHDQHGCMTLYVYTLCIYIYCICHEISNK